MSFIDKLNYIDLDDAKIDAKGLDNVIKEFIDSLFGGNALDLIKYKCPRLNKNLNDLIYYYRLLDLDRNLDRINFQVQLANITYKLLNLEKKKEEIVELNTNLQELNEAKKKLMAKKEYLNKLQKKGNVIENLKMDVEKVKIEFKECYNKAKAIEKVLENIGFKSAYSTESMNKLREEISDVKSRIQGLKEYTQLFENINSEHDLRLEISNLNEKLKCYKNLFIKSEEEN